MNIRLAQQIEWHGDIEGDMRPQGLICLALYASVMIERQTMTALYMYYYDLQMAGERRAFSTPFFSTPNTRRSLSIAGPTKSWVRQPLIPGDWPFS